MAANPLPTGTKLTIDFKVPPTFDPGSLGYARVVLLSGPLADQEFDDLPLFPPNELNPRSAQLPRSLAVPLSALGEATLFATYSRLLPEWDGDRAEFSFEGTAVVGGSALTDEVTAELERLATSAKERRATGAPAAPFAPAPRFVIEQSWWIGSELVRRHPTLRIGQMFINSGYDILRVYNPQVGAQDPRVQGVVDMNRNGRIHLHDVDSYEPITWTELLESNDPHYVLKRIERWRHWQLHEQAPATTPTSLTYRVISSFLTAHLNDRHRWDGAAAARDTDYGPAFKREWISTFPTFASAVEENRRSADDEFAHWSGWWALTRDGKPQVMLHESGFAHHRDGSTLELMRVYRDSDNIHDVTSALSGFMV